MFRTGFWEWQAVGYDREGFGGEEGRDYLLRRHFGRGGSLSTLVLESLWRMRGIGLGEVWR